MRVVSTSVSKPQRSRLPSTTRATSTWKNPQGDFSYGHLLLRPTVMSSTEAAIFVLNPATSWLMSNEQSRKARILTILQKSNLENEAWDVAPCICIGELSEAAATPIACTF